MHSTLHPLRPLRLEGNAKSGEAPRRPVCAAPPVTTRGRWISAARAQQDSSVGVPKNADGAHPLGRWRGLPTSPSTDLGEFGLADWVIRVRPLMAMEPIELCQH